MNVTAVTEYADVRCVSLKIDPHILTMTLSIGAMTHTSAQAAE